MAILKLFSLGRVGRATRSTRLYSVFFIYYTLVLAVALLAGVVIFSALDNIAEREIARANEGVLANTKNFVDIRLYEMQRLNFKLVYDISCKDFTKTGTLDWHQEVDLVNYLRNQQNMELNVGHIYVSSYRSKRTLSDQGVWDEELLYDMVFSDAFTQETWDGFKAKQHVGVFMPMRVNTVSSNPKTLLACVTSYLENDSIFLKPYGHAMILLDVEKLLSEAARVSGGQLDNTFYILNENGETIGSVGENKLPDDKDLLRDGESVRYTARGKAYLAFAYRSNIAPIRFVFVTPEGAYWQKVNQFRLIALFGLLLCLLTGAVTIVLLVRKSYKPVKALLTHVSQKAGFPYESDKNEFSFITESVNKLLTGTRNMDDKLSAINGYLRERSLRGILMGLSPITDELATHEIRFGGGRFVVALCRAENYGILFDKDKDIKTQSGQMVRFLINNVASELYGAYGDCYCAADSDEVAFILCAAPERLAEIYAASEKLQRFFRQELQITLTVALGRDYGDAAEIGKSYADAQDAMEYRFLLGGGSVILPTVADGRETVYPPLQNEQQKLLSIMRSSAKDALGEWLDSVLNPELLQNVTVNLAKSVVYGVVSIVSAVASETVPEDSETYSQAAFALISHATVAEFKAHMLTLLETMCEQVSEPSKKHYIVENVIKFVERARRDPNLNVDAVGRYMNLSASYVSKIFHSQTGTLLSDYIHFVRIKESKYLLKNSQRTISEIAQDVGYLSANTFVRIFKKYIGVPPGQYRISDDG